MDLVTRELAEALVKALRAFLHTCEHTSSNARLGPMCGEPAMYYHAGYEGEIWWACKKHGTDKRFHWIGDFVIDPAQVAARDALAQWEAMA